MSLLIPRDSRVRSRIAIVRVDLHINRSFHYLVPEELREQVMAGTRVQISFGRRKVLGTVLEVSETLDGLEVAADALKPILEVVGASGLITPAVLQLAKWMADYYLCPLDLALKSVAPAVVQKKGKMRAVRSRRDPELEMAVTEASTLTSSEPPPLMAQQEAVLSRMFEWLDADSSQEKKPVLLHGITGSGKTEVYLQVIARALEQGKGAIMLVPEISLTPQTVERLRARFAPLDKPEPNAGTGSKPEGGILAVLHSGLSQGERFREWQRIREGKARLVVGARSAIFAPVMNLGVIVVDEEHEHSYKQEEHPRYHARDVAVMRGHFEKALVILGSATPALESYHNAIKGKYHLCRMPERVDGRHLPKIRIIDMRQETLRQKGFAIFSEPLKSGIQLRLERGEQVILYLNRRGYSSSMLCPKCGFVATCPHCSVSLSYHRQAGTLQCHFCGYAAKAFNVCPQAECRDPSIRFAGMGTEKLEEAVSRAFPTARVARMDSDTMTRRDAYERTLLRFRMGKIDILLGTQMIAKGLDFPRVTLVGIVFADLGLHFPDFRSGERTFQQIVQVAGRAGRGDVEGEVVVQTFTPQHPVMKHIRKQDYEGFYQEEIGFRSALQYPPCCRITKIECASEQSSRAQYVIQQLHKLLLQRLGPSIRVLGPSPSPIEKVRGRYRHHLILWDTRKKEHRGILQEIFASLPRDGEVKVFPDVDPIQML
jgi:primosomal protein N' (replication factor Y) (superfamily II helicase)